MIIHNISDSIVFNALRAIHYGFLEIIKLDGTVLEFGNKNDELKVKIFIKNPSLTCNLIKNGSIGLAESYMKGEFETEDLTALIELNAKNINTTHRFVGFFEFSLINNFLKNNILSNTKNRSKKKT